jgi:glycosyltransferase involved in cell wall biosynthesis
MEDNNIKYSFIVPVFNEEIIIKKVIIDLSEFIQAKFIGRYEIIIVNDGSSDKTGDMLEGLNLDNIRVVGNPYNKGYGSALKLGARRAQGEYLIFYDGDGQHNPVDALNMINVKADYDMVVGSRQGYKGPAWRQPGKKILNIVANYLVNFNIPDLNSGMRLVRKEYFNKFTHLYPDGFSLTTTITLAFLKQGFSVKYVPININKRKGQSQVRISDGFTALKLILRMIMLFSPLKLFIPVFLFFSLITAISLIIDIFIYHFNLSQATLICFIATMLFLSVGLIADQLAALRREINLKN